LIEKDHLGDWSPEKDLFVTDVSTTCAEAILRLHLTLKMASAQVVKMSGTNNSPQGFLIFCRDVGWTFLHYTSHVAFMTCICFIAFMIIVFIRHFSWLWLSMGEGMMWLTRK